MKKAFIFDMDGVIVDTEPVHFRTKLMALEKYGIHCKKEDLERFVGRTTVHAFTTLLNEHPEANVSVDEIVKAKYEFYSQAVEAGEFHLVEGIQRLLDRLKANDFIIGIGTSAALNIAEKNLARAGLRDYFQEVVSGADLPRSKPDPAVYLKAAELLGVEPKNCTVVEDAASGVAAAKAAGMRCIGYNNPNSGKQDLSKADIIVNALDEITV